MREFWNDTLNRMLWTMAEAALAILTGKQLIQDIPWVFLVSSVAFAGLFTFLKCVAKYYKDKVDDEVLTEADIEMYEEDEDDSDELEQE